MTKDDEKVYIQIDGQKLNLAEWSPKIILAEVINRVFDQNSSLNALRELARGLTGLLEEVRLVAYGRKGLAAWTAGGFCTRMVKSLEPIIAAETREFALAQWYEILLRLDGLGRLGGFSVVGGIEQGLLNYSPEKRSIMKMY